MLNPVFSTKHLRDMTPLFYEIIHKVMRAPFCGAVSGVIVQY